MPPEAALVAPWDDETVKAINRYQKVMWFHPFTCPNQEHPEHIRLVASNEALWCPAQDCDYRQNWVHAFMTQPPPELPEGIDLGYMSL